jgi:ABC-type lipoprotein export system ATPase subunit
MAEPSFHGLCEALKFPDLRVRFITGLPTAVPPRILGLRIVGHKGTDNTFFDDTVLGFSDNLTCLIGPRGSGKSALIDSLRYLMGYNRTLDQIPKVADQVVDRQKHTLEKSRIEALYQASDGRIYTLVATYDPQEGYVTEVYDLDGNRLSIDDVDACGEFPLNLFGWGEIELLAESPNTQRELLDRFIPDVAAMKDEKRDILRRLDERDFRRLNEFKKQYDELNTEAVQAVFTKLDAVKAKRRVLKSMERVLQDRLDEGDIAPALELGKHLEDDALREWTEAFSARLKPDELDDWMLEVNRQHESKVQTAMGLVRTEDEKLARQEDAAEKEIRAAIGEEQVITGDLRNRAKSRHEKAAANYAEYKAYQGFLESLLDERGKLLDDLNDCDKRIFATRNRETRCIGDQVSLVEDENYQIDLVLNQQADRSTFLASLLAGCLVFHGHWKAGRHSEILSDNLTPRELARVILSEEVEAFDCLSVQVDGDHYTMDRKHVEHFIADNIPFTKVEGLETVHVDTERLDKILRVQQIPVDDDFFITLGGKPIQHCSPGQRCSAMLPVVALTSQAPLVIDQPEDNLDNRLVSRALFKILARLKETRQLILATHNPNILVSGDAEQVLLLNADGNLEKYGCIDNPAVIDSVLGLMEGGAEAFNRRRTKYEPFL